MPRRSRASPNLGAVSRSVDTPPPTFVVTQKTKLRSTLTAKRTSFSFFANSKQETVKVELLRPPGATRGSGSPKLGPPNASSRLTTLATPRGKRALPRKTNELQNTTFFRESRPGKTTQKEEKRKDKGDKPPANGPLSPNAKKRVKPTGDKVQHRKNRNSPAFANSEKFFN